jgi:hypothetical protein
MEPELEDLAWSWSPAKRLEAARKMEWWARQLRRSAFILMQPADPRAGTKSFKVCRDPNRPKSSLLIIRHQNVVAN